VQASPKEEQLLGTTEHCPVAISHVRLLQRLRSGHSGVSTQLPSVKLQVLVTHKSDTQDALQSTHDSDAVTRDSHIPVLLQRVSVHVSADGVHFFAEDTQP